jgi:hypothetical protein
MTLRERYKKPWGGSVPSKPPEDTVTIQYGSDSRKVPRGTLKRIIDASRNKVDPYNSLAIAYQESGIDSANPYHLNPNYYPSHLGGPEAGVQSIQQQMKYANNLRNKGVIPQGEDYQLQGYNGYGKIWSDHADLEGAKKIYGQSIPDTGLDLKKNPLYGKRIMAIKEALRKNPEIVNMVNSSADYLPAYKPKATIKPFGNASTIRTI